MGLTVEDKASIEGQTAKFGTGAVRSADAEGYRFDLISPIAMRRVAMARVRYHPTTTESGLYRSSCELRDGAVRAIYDFLSGRRDGDPLALAAKLLLVSMQVDATPEGEWSRAVNGEQGYLSLPYEGLKRVAEACHEGAVKYADFNWERGMPVWDLLNHSIRHLYLFGTGDRSEDHIGHATWGVFSAIHSDELWPDLNAGTLRSHGCIPPITDDQQRGANADD